VIVGVAGHVAEPSAVVPLVNVTVPVGTAAPATAGIVKVRDVEEPTVVGEGEAATVSPVFPAGFTVSGVVKGPPA